MEILYILRSKYLTLSKSWAEIEFIQIHELILGESAIATQSSVVRRIWDSYEYETLQPYEETTFLPLPIDKIEEEEKKKWNLRMRVS